MTSPQTMFERYGGFATVSKIVSDFYGRVQDSDIASPYFVGSDMRTLVDHQTKFIASLMDGPASYTDEHLERVHARLNINEEAFDEIVMLLTETLEDNGLAKTDVTQVCKKFASSKHYIVTGG
jgi:hemoglobin